MAEYLIYGKRTKPWYNEKTKEWVEPDKTFRALTATGIRVTKLKNAMSFATKEDAQEFLDQQNIWRDGTVFDIRRAR